MSGKLPIDRVRANEDAPSTYQREKERFTKKRARLRQEAAARAEERPAPVDTRAKEPGNE